MLWYVFADFACLQTVHSWEDKGCTHKATLPCMPKSRMQLRGCDKLVLLYFMGFGLLLDCCHGPGNDARGQGITIDKVGQ